MFSQKADPVPGHVEFAPRLLDPLHHRALNSIQNLLDTFQLVTSTPNIGEMRTTLVQVVAHAQHG